LTVDKLAKVFEYNGAQVRTVTTDQGILFVAGDVCAILDVDPTQTRRLDPDEKGLCLIHTPGGTQQMVAVTESGLYALVLGSRKPEAREFKRWITHEVLPQIRQTGAYAAQPLSQIQILQQAVGVLAQQEQALKELRGEVAQQGQALALVKETFAARPDEWRRAVGDGVKQIAKAQERFHQLVWDEFYGLLEERGHCDLGLRLRNIRERLASTGAPRSKVSAINRLDAIDADPVLQELSLAIIKEMVAKYAA
jgi:prophage antirepressor-like protein